MGFTTQVFLFIFFPVSLAFYYLCLFAERKGWFSGCVRKLRLKDWTLFAFSLAFYGWARISGIKELILYIVTVYFLARLIAWCKMKKLIIPMFQDDGENCRCLWKIYFSQIVLIFSVFSVLFVLFRCKYWNFALGKPIYAALGISFLTFSALSYLIDVYKGTAKAGSFLGCALYLSFFLS